LPFFGTSSIAFYAFATCAALANRRLPVFEKKKSRPKELNSVISISFPCMRIINCGEAFL
jgi:hypothetical protein